MDSCSVFRYIYIYGHAIFGMTSGIRHLDSRVFPRLPINLIHVNVLVLVKMEFKMKHRQDDWITLHLIERKRTITQAIVKRSERQSLLQGNNSRYVHRYPR